MRCDIILRNMKKLEIEFFAFRKYTSRRLNSREMTETKQNNANTDSTNLHSISNSTVYTFHFIDFVK